ncbi:hypothetical protein ILUMI_06845 [Ignelater luminosus]|uniref:AAA+ ATPase domain-containing protein n=1 Tax=Ignelater luminosus TaxID=2038154 RepID=A0A8K0D9F6_IGNLU|nr:hypothetical protein ILUMI_06845 [Ignelater luminosus]
MSGSKSKKKPTNPWFQCEKCKVNIPHDSLDIHCNDCPPSISKLLHHFIKDEVLYGVLDNKINEDIKGISSYDRDNLVFVNQSCMQLCNFAIGDHVILRDIRSKYPPCAHIVWPTEEKSLVSILLTKNGLDSSFEGEKDIDVCISKIMSPVIEAQRVLLIGINFKNKELFPDLSNRIQRFYLNRLLTEGNQILIMYYGKMFKFEVKLIKSTEEKSSKGSESLEDRFNELALKDDHQFYKVIKNTKFYIFKYVSYKHYTIYCKTNFYCRNEDEYNKELVKQDLLSTIGGLHEEISEIRDLMNVALGKIKSISRSTISRGVLLYGSPGTGKTLLAKALIKESNTNVINISMTELYTSSNSDAEDVLKQTLKDAIIFSPVIVFIDEIDSFCPSKTSRLTDSDKKVTAHLLNLFDYINENPDLKIFILATSNKPDSIDSTFRRCGRLDREIEIPTPNPNGRLDILKKLLHDVPLDVDDNLLRMVANAAHGFVGSDLVALCSRAALHSTKRGDTKICMEDLKYALTRVRPSAMREVQIEVPDVKWTDIGGQSKLKLILRQAVEWPLKYPESFIRMGITPPRGVLMFGPPGCSKTMIAKALATESGLNFLSIKGPELFSKWVGESERAVREVFRKARQVAPSVIFFDEIDALGGERSSGSSTSVQERVLAQLLTELDGVTPLGDVTVLAATNRPDRIDKALLRPGRLDRIVYVPLPDDDTRKEIFKLKLCKMPVTNVNIDELVNLTEGYSGAEVNAVCHEAAMKALEENLKSESVEMGHFQEALKIITPRTSPSLLKIYEDYLKQ